MPTFRSDLASIPAYTPGRPIDEVAHDLGLTDIVKLASNECPTEPFPEVTAAITSGGADLHRYPETTAAHVRHALALHFNANPDNFLVGHGSSQLIQCAMFAAGGPGTNAVFASPSFVMYTIGAALTRTQPEQIPLDPHYRHDLDAMAQAVDNDTRVVVVCNPNNPTGTYVSGEAVAKFVERIPDHVLVLIDEAYAEYVTAPDWETAIPIALARPNVVVSRTFSKIYGLAGLRVGYFVGRAETLDGIRRVQPPFSVTTLGQIAAVEALRHQHLVADRAAQNAAGRDLLRTGLAQRGVKTIPSEANFIALVPESGDPPALERELLARGVIVRTLGDLARITVGTADENQRLLEAWDDIT